MFKNLFLGNTKVDFYKKSKFFYKVFIIEITIFIGIIIMVFTNTLDLNLSVDFTGGTTYQFDTEYSSEDISDVMNSNILEVSRYQTFENSNSIIFRATEASSEEEAQFLDYLSNKFNIPDSEIEFQRVGPTFGQEITQKGLRALIIFLSFIVILITYRYEFRYSLIALAALLLIIPGFFTDLIGFLLLIPFTRNILLKIFLKKKIVINKTKVCNLFARLTKN